MTPFHWLAARLYRRAPTKPPVKLGSLRCSCATCVGGAALSGRDMMKVAGAPIAVFGLERIRPEGVEKHAVCVIDDTLFQAVVMPAIWAHLRAKKEQSALLNPKDLACALDPRA